MINRNQEAELTRIAADIDQRAADKVLSTQAYAQEDSSLFEALPAAANGSTEKYTEVIAELVTGKVLKDLELGPDRPYYTFHDVERVGKLAAKLALESTVPSTAEAQGEQ